MLTDARGCSIALIVDSVERDLDGLILLGCVLAQQNITVHLVPIYFQAYVLPKKSIDLACFNYIRANNLWLFVMCKALGIKVGVIDTEGNPNGPLDRYVDLNAQILSRFRPDFICIWGERVRRAFAKGDLPFAETKYTTGCLRYDFMHEDFSSILDHSDTQAKEYILITSKFSSVRPKLVSSPENEYKSGKKRLIEKNGLTEAEAQQTTQRVIRGFESAYEKFLVSVEAIIKAMPDSRFVLRPHPFEDPSPYFKLSDRYHNVSVNVDLTSVELIYNSIALVTFQCNTAQEASILGKPVFEMQWLDNEITRSNKPSFDVSEKCVTIDALLAKLEEVVRQEYTAPSSVTKIRKKAIEEQFYKIDGKAHIRITDLIVEALADPPTRKGNLIQFRLIRAIGAFVWFKQFLRLILGPTISTFLSGLFDGGRSLRNREQKSFTAERIIRQLNQIARHSDIETSGLVVESDLLVKQGTHACVTIKRHSRS